MNVTPWEVMEIARLRYEVRLWRSLSVVAVGVVAGLLAALLGTI